MAESRGENAGLIVHERHRNMSTKAITGRQANEESGLTSDRRDFLKVAVMAAAGAALPVSAASWASTAAAQSTQRKGEAYKMKTRKLGGLEVSELGFGCMSIRAATTDRQQTERKESV